LEWRYVKLQDDGCPQRWYDYGGTFAAPNRSGAISNITIGSSGQALNTYTDYENGNQADGCVETSVFQERAFVAADAGSYTFAFQTEVPGTLGPDVTTFGFVKLLDSGNNYNDVFEGNAITSTASAGFKSITVDLDESSDGFILQWGFTTVASKWQDSGRWYDNVYFGPEANAPVPPDDGDDFEGIPIPGWALFIMAGMLAYLGATQLRSRRKI
jgi:hypothetical protein